MSTTHDDDSRVPVVLSERQCGEVRALLAKRDAIGRRLTRVTVNRRTFVAILDRLSAFSQIAAVLGECEHCGKPTPIGLCPPHPKP